MAKTMKYIGPRYKKGLILPGSNKPVRPMHWPQAQVAKNLKKYPSMAKHFEEVTAAAESEE